MKTTIETTAGTFPIELRAGLIISDAAELAALVLEETNAQVLGKALPDEDEIAEFQQACDALNLRRVLWRCEEANGGEELSDLDEELSRIICSARAYDEDEFVSAKVATHERVRLPYGFSPLELAWARAKRSPIRLLHPDLTNSRICNSIAAIARQLHVNPVGGPMLLPIEQLRILLGCRKLLASGAVIRLREHQIIEDLGKPHHTGRAREFRLIAVEGQHYELVKKSENAGGPPHL